MPTLLSDVIDPIISYPSLFYSYYQQFHEIGHGMYYVRTIAILSWDFWDIVVEVFKFCLFLGKAMYGIPTNYYYFLFTFDYCLYDDDF